MQYNIRVANAKRRVPKVIWSKAEASINEEGVEVWSDLSFIFTEDTLPRNIQQALEFVHRHADVLPTDTIRVSQQTEWNYRNENFRPAYTSVLVFDGGGHMVRDETDAANALDEGEVVLEGDDIIDSLSDADIDYLYELLDQDMDIYVVADSELPNG